MVGPARPAFVLFGSSIVQFSSGQGGWGATLATLYARKADIFVRGYASWNTRLALKVLDKVFPKEDPAPPSLVIVYFGGNDTALPRENNMSSHVPLDEYLGNMTTIVARLQFTYYDRDGMHFTEKESQVVVKEILKTIKEAEWEPKLHWQDMTSEFDDVSYMDDDEKETIV
ncbi:GDSL esterase/lipase WDL1-like [Bidens hawaiensis]|uniref:GDSL esterase/lipase WDL1-like n=1 Tax=Bidens hawaiensis TaxID=980011 RepID=UPI00404B65E2